MTVYGVLRWPAQNPLRAIVVAALLAILSALGAARLRSDTSLESLFPKDDPAAAALSRVLNQFSAAEELLLLVTTPGNQPQPERLLAFAGRLERQIAADGNASKLVGVVQYRADAASRDFVTKVVVPNGLFYLSDAEFEAAQRRLTRPEMAEQFRRNQAMLAAPGPAAGALAKVLLQDPLRLHEFIEGRLASSRPFKTYQNSDAFLSSDGRSLLIRIAGVKPPSDMEFCHQITAAVTASVERANDDRLEVEISGAYPIAAQSERLIRHDSISSVNSSVLCLAALFVLAFRRPIRLFAVTFTPVALGVLYGFGVYSIFSRGITPLTAVIGAVLAGIGIDYAIFYLVHYHERRDAGAAPVDAAGDTIRTIGGALVAAWATSVVGFVAVGFSSVRLLRDFSIVGSLGLAGALLGAVFILPALLVLQENRGRPAADCRAARLSLRSLLGWIDRHAGASLAVSLCGLLVAVGWLAVAGPWLRMETDPTVLHPRPNPPLDAEADIARRMGSAPDSLIVYLHAQSPQSLLVLAHRANERLSSPAARAAGVTSTFGIASLLPDPAVVPRRLEQVGKERADRVIADFDAVVADSAFSPEAYRPYESFLRRLLTPAAAPGIADLLACRQLAEALLPRPSSSNRLPTEAITLVFVGRTMNERESRQACVTQLRSVLADLPGATLTGMSVLSLDTERTIQRDFPRLTVAAVGIVALCLLIHFRSLSHAVLAILPTLCSLTLLLAFAKVAGARMNLANIVSIPLLIGIDVDYGIFVVSVSRQSRSRTELLERVTASSQAVILCAASTLLGFGSLAFTSVPAVRSLGWAVVIGVCTCAISTLFVLLPILLLRLARQVVFPNAKPLVCLLVVVFGGLTSGGCSAPNGRLSFPTSCVAKADGIEWYDVHHRGWRDFGIAYDPTGRVDRLLYDDDGDGHVDRECRPADYANERVPHLILLLDSIPFETMRERYQAGDFRWFDPPQKMIAPFPSLTEVCYGDVLHAPPLPGATDQYFDPRDEQRKEILWERFKGFEQPWERRLHYHSKFWQQGLSFLKPDEWYAAELELAYEALERSPDRVTLVYIGSAASMVCKYGKPGAERVLDGARQLCLQLLYERRGAIKISMMADHGHNYMPSQNISLAEMLKSAGFHPADRLTSNKDCVVEVNALVTCAGIHTRRPAEVAAALCQHHEIDLAIYMQGDRAIVRSKQGCAAIECNHRSLCYDPLDADVLGYASLNARLKDTWQMRPEGFATDEVWFGQTLNREWPNAPRRIWDALHARFLNPPTVLLSLKDGYCAGNPDFEHYIKMASTHGGLNQLNSATFVMTMTGRLTGAVRHEDVLGILEPGFEPRVQR